MTTRQGTTPPSRRNNDPARRPALVARRPALVVGVVLGAGLLASGCAAPIVGALTVADLMTGASVTSTVLTGRSTNEHVASLALDQDCRLLEGMLSADRDVCEQPGAYVTDDDFRGLVGLFDRREIQVAAVGEGPWTQVAGAPFPSVPTLARALDRAEREAVALAALPAPAYALPGSAPLAPVQVAELAAPPAGTEIDAGAGAATDSATGNTTDSPEQLAAIAPAAGPAHPAVAAPVLPEPKPGLVETALMEAPVLPRPKPEGIGPARVKVAVLPQPKPEFAAPPPRREIIASGRGETAPGQAPAPMIVQWRTVNGRQVGQPVQVVHMVDRPAQPGPVDI
ncbi:hypothetical protein [Roseospirillum parvum]|uniref:Uncharacterized protein n=1 Tax=Roseospirillum parvum TaxID=83401 RepID=A0A1G8B814_9PROT|nr:hypothetical protein [Roseospirillum parvum]SDH29392.1 hypothetical protein SAMN05421742_105270 [Roseospirillum parvum]